MTVKEAAEILQIKERQVRNLVESGELKAKRKGRRAWDIYASSVGKYARSRRPVGRPVGTLSGEPARSKRYGEGTERAEREREYQRTYRRERRAKGLS